MRPTGYEAFKIHMSDGVFLFSFFFFGGGDGWFPGVFGSQGLGLNVHCLMIYLYYNKSTWL